MTVDIKDLQGNTGPKAPSVAQNKVLSPSSTLLEETASDASQLLPDSAKAIAHDNTLASMEPRSRIMKEFGLCSNLLSELIRTLESRSQDCTAMVHRYTSDNAEHLWAAIEEFPLKGLSQENRAIDSEQIDDAVAIRQLFPELISIPIAHLYHWYSEYQASCRYIDLPSCDRSPGFLFFLLGQLAPERVYLRDPQSPLNAGMFIAFAFLKGATTELALDIGTTCYALHQNLNFLAKNASATCMDLSPSTES